MADGERKWLRRGKAAMAVAAMALAGAAMALAGAAPASAATWIGSVHGRIVRSSRLVSGGTNWQGDFSISVGRGGAVTGYATVGYVPEVDLSGVNNAIGYIKSLLSLPLGLPELGPFGPAANAIGLGNIIGAGVSFNEAMAVRQGSLSGHLSGGRLTLNWHLARRGIPYQILFVLATGSKPIGNGVASLFNPFNDTGTRKRSNTISYAHEGSSTSKGITQLVGTYWVAHRVR